MANLLPKAGRRLAASGLNPGRLDADSIRAATAETGRAEHEKGRMQPHVFEHTRPVTCSRKRANNMDPDPEYHLPMRARWLLPFLRL
jgi:hypothetical protein